MIPPLPNTLHWLAQRHPRALGASGAAALALTGAGLYLLLRRTPSPEELERRRREALATTGRITDGHLVDARTLSGEECHSETPELLVYSYELAGVTYECAQDVSLLPERVRGFRPDQPVQVRYDPRHPGNSIVVAESWSGLRTL